MFGPCSEEVLGGNIYSGNMQVVVFNKPEHGKPWWMGRDREQVNITHWQPKPEFSTKRLREYVRA